MTVWLKLFPSEIISARNFRFNWQYTKLQSSGSRTADVWCLIVGNVISLNVFLTLDWNGKAKWNWIMQTSCWRSYKHTFLLPSAVVVAVGVVKVTAGVAAGAVVWAAKTSWASMESWFWIDDVLIDASRRSVFLYNSSLMNAYKHYTTSSDPLLARWNLTNTCLNSRWTSCGLRVPVVGLSCGRSHWSEISLHDNLQETS